MAVIRTCEAVFQIRGVSEVYHMGDVDVHALRLVDLDLFQGELAVLLGASGSGKSTLLNIIGGLDVPTAGSVTFRDHDLTAANDSQLTEYRRDHVGFVFQFYNLIPSLTALEPLFRNGEEWNIFVVERGRAVQRQIVSGHQSATETEILDGLSDRDIVILHPPSSLEDSSPVDTD